MGHYTRLARNRDFTLLWSGGALRELGGAMAAFALPLIAFAVSGSALEAGWVAAMAMVGFVLLVLPAGVVVDRVDRRLVLLGTSLLGLAGYGSVVAAALVADLTTTHLAAVALLSGCGEAFSRPAEMASIRRLVDRDDLPAAISQNVARSSVADLGGGPLSGLALGLTRWAPFAAAAAGYLASVLCALAIRGSLAAPEREVATTLRSDLVQGLRFVVRSPFRRAFFVYAAMSNLVTAAVLLLVALRMLDAGWSPFVIGLTETASGLAGLAGATAAPQVIDRVGTGWIAIASAFAMVVAVTPLVWTVHPVAVCLLLPIGIGAQPVMIAGVSSYLLTTTPESLQGRISTATNFVTHVTVPLGPLLTGVLVTAFGFVTTTAVLAALLLLCALYVLSRAVVRDVGTPDTWPDEPEPVPAALGRGRHRSGAA
ncbi:MFS transporter [Solicola sp. PLA-1-18]|uniref:MFS transporter n=1 Tax=Solicola sp. PLA-1-18 TaxID=3380532 RepID=UPI003B77CC21